MEETNYKKGLVEYFKKNLNKGYTSDSLKIALVNQGYSRIAVEKAIEETHKELAKQAPILKEKPKIKYEIIDEFDKPIFIKKPWWRRVFD